MDWSTIVSGLVGAAGVPLIGFAFTCFLPREKTLAFGQKLRVMAQSLLAQKIGKAASDATVGRFATTLHDLADGFMSEPQ